LSNRNDCVVIDTNIFVAAGFKPSSHAARIIADIRRGCLRMPWCRATHAEIRHTLERIPPLDWQPFADCFLPAEEQPDPADLTPFAAIPDPADRVFAALAAASRAILVSNDSHLLDHQAGLSIEVCTPRDFLWE
jgi:predicted nucleic acid-binding protein